MNNSHIVDRSLFLSNQLIIYRLYKKNTTSFLKEIFMTEGVWGLIGVLVGGLITFFSQVLFYKMENKKTARKYLLENYEFFTQKTRDFNVYISQLRCAENIINENAIEEVDLFEYQNTLDQIAERSYDNFEKFLSIVYEFFPQVITNSNFKDFIYVVNELITSTKRIKTGYSDEIIRNRYEMYIQNKNRLINTGKFLQRLSSLYQIKIFGRKAKNYEINILT